MVVERSRAEQESEEPEVPLWLVLWGRAVETLLSTVYFLLISAVAVAIDLGLHYFEKLGFVEHLALSRIIRWEIELMAYALATVDCFLFLRRLIQPVILFVVSLVRR